MAARRSRSSRGSPRSRPCTVPMDTARKSTPVLRTYSTASSGEV